MLTLAQADPAASSALYSVAGILTATWLIVAFAKRLAPEYIVGRVTLLVALAVSVGLTLYARYGAGWIDADLPSTLLAVLTGVAGAAGIDASGRAVMGKTPAVLIPLGLSLVMLGGCSTMSPSQRYAFSSNGFSATVDQVAVLIELGLIEDDNLDDIQSIAHEIAAEFDAWDVALRNNIPLDSRFVLARVERLLGRLVQYQLDAGQGVSHGPGNSSRVGHGGDQSGGEDHGLGRPSPGRAPGLDDSRARRGEGDPQGVGVEPGRRDRLASQLRQLDRRHAGLVAVASR